MAHKIGTGAAAAGGGIAWLALESFLGERHLLGRVYESLHSCADPLLTIGFVQCVGSLPTDQQDVLLLNGAVAAATASALLGLVLSRFRRKAERPLEPPQPDLSLITRYEILRDKYERVDVDLKATKAELTRVRKDLWHVQERRDEAFKMLLNNLPSQPERSVATRPLAIIGNAHGCDYSEFCLKRQACTDGGVACRKYEAQAEGARMQ